MAATSEETTAVQPTEGGFKQRRLDLLPKDSVGDRAWLEAKRAKVIFNTQVT